MKRTRTEDHAYTDAEIGRILQGADMLRAWLAAVEEEAMRRLTKRPTCIPGFRLGQSTPHRRWKNPDALAVALAKRQAYDLLAKPQPLAPGAMERLLTAKRAKHPLAALWPAMARQITRNEPQPRIVREEDGGRRRAREEFDHDDNAHRSAK